MAFCRWWHRDEKDFVWRPGIFPAMIFFTFFNSFHQIHFCVEPSCCIDEERSTFLALAAWTESKATAEGSEPLECFDEICPHSFGPDLKLFQRQRPERYQRRRSGLSSPGGILMSNLRNGGCLTHTIDAHYHNKERFRLREIDRKWFLTQLENSKNLLPDEVFYFFSSWSSPLFSPL